MNMKKMFYSVLLVLGVVCMVSACSSGNATPGDTAKQYAGYVLSGKYDKIMDICQLGENVSTEEKEAGKAFLTGLLKMAKEGVDKEHGGYKTIDVVSENISEDGMNADVVIKYTFGDGQTKEETLGLVRQDGAWKLKIGVNK